MASTIFHHWLDQFRALPRTRRHWVLGALLVLAAAVIFALGIAVGRGLGLPNGLEARAHRLAARNAALQDQNQSLAQQQRTADTTVGALRQSLAGRDTELDALKQKQAFYTRLIGIDATHSGLGVHSVALTRIERTNAWNFTVTLVNTAEHADAARGHVTVMVEGVQGDRLVTLDWARLAGAGSKQAIPFAFKFFQQVHGSLALPKGFVPNRIDVNVYPEHGATVTRELGWKRALTSTPGADATP